MTGKSLFLALSLLAIVLSQRKHASQLLGQGCSKTIAVDQHLFSIFTKYQNSICEHYVDSHNRIHHTLHSLAAYRHARDDQVETSAHADGGPR